MSFLPLQHSSLAMSSSLVQMQTLVLYVAVAGNNAGRYGVGIFYDSFRLAAHNSTQGLEGPHEHPASDRDAVLKVRLARLTAAPSATTDPLILHATLISQGILIAVQRAPKYYSLKIEVEDQDVVAELDKAEHHRMMGPGPAGNEETPVVKAIIDAAYARAHRNGSGVVFIYSGLDVTAAGGLGKARE